MVWKCLYAFPFIWVSIVGMLICGRCLMMFDIAQILVCECQALLTLFISTEHTMLFSAVQYVSGYCRLLCFKPADKACP